MLLQGPAQKAGLCSNRTQHRHRAARLRVQTGRTWNPCLPPSFQGSRPHLMPTGAFNRGRGSEGPQTWNPVEVVKREQGLQSNKLPTAVREKVTDAVEELRFRVTVGDVAARAGVKLSQADDALKALAYDSNAALEVSEQGDVVYSFPRNFKSTIQSRSLWLKTLPVLKGAQRVAGYLVRILFGTALVSSVAIVWFAIAVLLSSSRRDDRRSDNRGYYNPYYGSYNGGGMGARVFFDLTDLLIYLDPNYARHSRQRVEQGANMTFLEAIFSFVFGDGDPNAQFDEERWAALGQMISDRGGVVTAEEMAPYLDPPQPQPVTTGAYPDESFVLPALIRFGGEPEVDEDTGRLLYRFPSLQTSAVTQEWVRGPGGRPPARAGREAVEVLQEAPWELTAASPGQLIGVIALGIFNVVGVITLGALLADPAARYTLAYQGLGWVGGLMPALQLYAATFFGIPLFRTLGNLQKNAAIAERNTARSQAARMLNSGARWIQEKLAAARRLGSRRTVRKSDVIYTTDKDTNQQMNNREEEEWDRAMRSRQGQRQEHQGALPPPSHQPAPTRGNFERGKRPARDYDGRWQ